MDSREQFGLDQTIQNMLAFMEIDLEEALEDMEDDIDETYTVTRNRIISKGIEQTKRFYDKQEKKMIESFNFEEQVWLHQGRLEELHARHRVVQEIVHDSRGKILKMITNRDMYQRIVQSLLLQGLFKMLEPTVIVVYRSRDEDILPEVMNNARRRYRIRTGKDIRLLPGPREAGLPDDVLGGVALISASGRISTDVTLAFRLEHVAETMLPEIRGTLFCTDNRRYHDTITRKPQYGSVMELLKH